MEPLPGKPAWSPASDTEAARPVPGRTGRRLGLILGAGIAVVITLAVVAFLNAHAADGGCGELFAFDPAYAHSSTAGVEYHILGVTCTFDNAPSIYRPFWFL